MRCMTKGFWRYYILITFLMSPNFSILHMASPLFRTSKCFSWGFINDANTTVIWFIFPRLWSVELMLRYSPPKWFHGHITVEKDGTNQDTQCISTEGVLRLLNTPYVTNTQEGRGYVAIPNPFLCLLEREDVVSFSKSRFPRILL